MVVTIHIQVKNRCKVKFDFFLTLTSSDGWFVALLEPIVLAHFQVDDIIAVRNSCALTRN